MPEIDFFALSPAEKQAILDGPALEPPDGVIPNFDDPPNGNTMVRIVYGTCLALSTTFVAARVYGVWRSSRKFYISDYLMLISFGLYVALIAVIFPDARLGYFVHQWNFRIRDVVKILYLFNIAANLFGSSIMAIKAAILLEWLRIFHIQTRNTFYWITVLLLSLNFIFYAVIMISYNLVCIPHEKIWNRVQVPGKCIDSRPLDIAWAVVYFVIDIAILILPQKVIWKLNMSFGKRLGVSAVFAVGLMACFAAGSRLAVAIDYFKSEDHMYSVFTLGIWVIVETTCAIIVFCVPALPKALSNLGVQHLYSSLKSFISRTTTTSERSNIELKPQSRFSNPYNKISGHDDANSGSLGSRTRFANHSDVEAAKEGQIPDNAILHTTYFAVTAEDRSAPNTNSISLDRL